MKELLTADELSSLLTAVSEGQVPAGGSGPQARERQIQTYDFRRSERLTREQVRALQHVHRHAAIAISGALSDLLRAPVEASLVGFEAVPYGTLNAALPNPTGLQIVRVRPADRPALLVLDLPLALGMVDRILGGQGRSVAHVRPLTALEEALLATPVRAILERLAAAWAPVARIEFQPEALRMDPKVVQVFAVQETLLRFHFAVGGEACVGDVAFCLPLAFIDQVLPRDKTDFSALLYPKEGKPTSPEVVQRALGAAPVHVAIELGRTYVSVLDLLNLQPGHVVRLERELDEPLDGTVEGKPYFTAHPGLVGKRLGVQIVSPPALPGSV
jgi:flagellar motor switch protein FliM